MCEIAQKLNFNEGLHGSSGLPEIFSHTGSRVNHTEQIRLVGLY